MLISFHPTGVIITESYNGPYWPVLLVAKQEFHIILCQNHPGFETLGEGHMKSKIEATSGPTKWTLVQQKMKKK